jgi:type IV pilus assembly protein PilV
MNRSSPRTTKGQGGAALLEVLIAVLVFSLGILGTVGMLATTNRVASDARYRMEAANIATGLVADMWTTAPNQVDVQFGASGYGLASWQSKATALLPGSSGTHIAVDLTKPGISSQSRTVDVTVSWTLPGSTETHSYLLSAQIGRNP